MNSMSLASMAWRNLWRNRRRTLITLVGIAVGTGLAILFTGLGDDTYGKMIELAAKMGGGHVTIQHAEYIDNPSTKNYIKGIGKKTALAMANQKVKKVSPRITGFAMLSTARDSHGALIMAFDPQKEDKKTLTFKEAMVKGSFFNSRHDKGIILGKRLAEILQVKLGRKVVYTMSDKNGEMVSGLARVRGYISTGVASLDSNICLLTLDSIRKVVGLGKDEATQLAIFISDQRISSRVANQLSPNLKKGIVALAWHQVQPELAGFISMKVSGTVFFEIIIMLLVAAGIFNTIFVSVMERLREFGILMALGFSPAKLFILVTWESLWLGITGLIASALITAWPYHYLNTKGIDLTAMVGKGGTEISGVAVDPIMRVSIYPENALIIGLVVLGATLLSGIYPAWKAGRVEPVEAIKLV